MAVFVIYQTKLACDIIINCIAIYYEKDVRAGIECLHSKAKDLSPNFKKSADAESFQRNCQERLLAISLIWESTIVFLFSDTLTKEKKTVNEPFTERKVLIICAYISATQ